MDGWFDDGTGLLLEGPGLMGSAAVEEIVQTRHVVRRKVNKVCSTKTKVKTLARNC